jgi:hypothetical protein
VAADDRRGTPVEVPVKIAHTLPPQRIAVSFDLSEVFLPQRDR